MMNAREIDTGLSPPTDAPAAWIYGGVGLIQGAALWALMEALERKLWLGSSGPWLAAAFYLVIGGPLAWYLAAGGWRHPLRRLSFAAALALLLALLGAHAGSAWMDGEAKRLPVDHLLAAAVLGFLVVPLASGFDAARQRFDYSRLFEHSWRNAVLLPAAGGLTLMLWALLWAGALLLGSIGLDGLKHVLKQGSVIFLLSGGSFGLAIGLALGRAELLKASRQFSLSVNTWFLPLALALALVWVAALPFTGIEKLLQTHNAAFYLLWFATLATGFVNAAFQDGQEPPAYPRWLAKALSWAWLALLPLACLADWALAQRILQHGWSAPRLWASVAAFLITLYTLGYALSLLQPARWMARLPITNIAAALTLTALIVALISPLADVNRIAVHDQVARLHSGQIEPEQFDWQYLRFNSGPYGLEALRDLQKGQGQGPRADRIAQLAEQALAWQTTHTSHATATPQNVLSALKSQAAHLPAGSTPDEAWLQQLSHDGGSDWATQACVSAPARCALWSVDLDGDGQTEGVVISAQAGVVSARVYAKGPAGWQAQGRLLGGPRTLEAWTQDIENQSLKRLPKRWPDLRLGEHQITFEP